MHHSLQQHLREGAVGVVAGSRVHGPITGRGATDGRGTEPLRGHLPGLCKRNEVLTHRIRLQVEGSRQFRDRESGWALAKKSNHPLPGPDPWRRFMLHKWSIFDRPPSGTRIFARARPAYG
jgi:hypothetical protein